MKLIKNLPRKFINDYWVSMGIFWCDFCKQEVKKDLSSGKRDKSCGCNRGKGNKNGLKHGYTYIRLYRTWKSMKSRCLNISNKFYKDYGGRGVTICLEWVNDYIKFKDWSLSHGYADNLQINRINNDGNYEPSNCNFVTRTENMRNTRHCKINIKIANEIRELYNTGKYIQEELAKNYGIHRGQISKIVNNKIWG